MNEIAKEWVDKAESDFDTADLTLRIMYAYDREEQDSRVIFQVYYYKRIIF